MLRLLWSKKQHKQDKRLQKLKKLLSRKPAKVALQLNMLQLM